MRFAFLIVPFVGVAAGARCGSADATVAQAAAQDVRTAFGLCSSASDVLACVQGTTATSDCTKCAYEQFTADAKACLEACPASATTTSADCAACLLTGSLHVMDACWDPELVKLVTGVPATDKQGIINKMLEVLLTKAPATAMGTAGCTFPRNQLVTLFSDLSGCAAKDVNAVETCMTVRGYTVDATCASCLYDVEKTTCPCTAPFSTPCISCHASKIKDRIRECVPQHDTRYQGTGRALKCSLTDAALVDPTAVATLASCLDGNGGETCFASTMSTGCKTCLSKVYGRKANFKCKTECAANNNCDACNRRTIKAMLGRCTGYVDEVHDKKCTADDKTKFDAAGGVDVLINCKKNVNPRGCLGSSGIKEISSDCKECIAESASWSKARSCSFTCSLNPRTSAVQCRRDMKKCTTGTVDSVDVTYCFDPVGVETVVESPTDPSVCDLSDITAVGSAITPTAISSCFSQASEQEIYDCLQKKLTDSNCVDCVEAVLAATSLCTTACSADTTSTDCTGCLSAEIATAAGSCMLTGTPMYAEALASGNGLTSSGERSLLTLTGLGLATLLSLSIM